MGEKSGGLGGDDVVNDKLHNGEDDFSYKKVVDEETIETRKNNIRKYFSSSMRNITFTATMSAGKSTLINAITGRDIAYSKKAACTMSIMTFCSSPVKTDSVDIICDDKEYTVQTEQEVRNFTKNLKTECDIRCYFYSPLKFRQITLIDTPGVNSSRNPEHKNITRGELTGNRTDILVYVIPIQYYGSEDDFRHLTYIRKNVKYKEIIFAVNMMDSCSSEDDSVSEMLDKIKLHLESIGFERPIVCPMSAKAGMLIKRALCGLELSEYHQDECREYIDIFQRKNLALSEFYPESGKMTDGISSSWLKIDINAVWNAYINTGLPGFEALLYKITEEDTGNEESCYRI